MTFTITTCNEACWSARQEDCHCSCGGANHGILRPGHANYQGAEGEQPRRNCRIKGHRYVLAAVGSYSEASQAGRNLTSRHAATFRGVVAGRDAWRQRYEDERQNGPATVARIASVSETDRWPELKAFGDLQEAAGGRRGRPHLCWLREDLTHLEDA